MNKSHEQYLREIQQRLCDALATNHQGLRYLELPKSCQQIGKSVGKGGFAEVFELKNSDYVVKVVCPYYKIDGHTFIDDSSQCLDNEKHTRRECELLMEARAQGSLYIVPVEGWCEYKDLKNPREHTFFEFMPKMLKLTDDLIFGEDYINITEELIIQMGIDLCFAFRECGAILKIKHRDVRRDNILALYIAGDIYFALSDFNTVAKKVDRDSSIVSLNRDTPDIYKMHLLNALESAKRGHDEQSSISSMLLEKFKLNKDIDGDDFWKAYHDLDQVEKIAFATQYKYQDIFDWAAVGTMMRNMLNEHQISTTPEIQKIITKLCCCMYTTLDETLLEFAKYCPAQYTYNLAKKEAKMGHINFAIEIARTGMEKGDINSTRLYYYLVGWMKSNMSQSYISDLSPKHMSMAEDNIGERLLEFGEDYGDVKSTVLGIIYQKKYEYLEQYANDGNTLAQLFYAQYLLENCQDIEAAIDYLRKAASEENNFLLAKRMLSHYLKKDYYRNEEEFLRVFTKEVKSYKKRMHTMKELKKQRMQGKLDSYKEKEYTELFREYENDLLQFV